MTDTTYYPTPCSIHMFHLADDKWFILRYLSWDCWISSSLHYYNLQLNYLFFEISKKSNSYCFSTNFVRTLFYVEFMDHSNPPCIIGNHCTLYRQIWFANNNIILDRWNWRSIQRRIYIWCIFTGCKWIWNWSQIVIFYNGKC